MSIEFKSYICQINDNSVRNFDILRSEVRVKVQALQDLNNGKIKAGCRNVIYNVPDET